MDDLISRQMALDAIMGQPPEPHYPSWYAAQIEELPAVQPATNCSEIPNGSDDTISRQAAIDAMGKAKWAKERLMELPAAQPNHVADISKKAEGDCISRQAAIDVALEDVSDKRTHEFNAGAIRAVNRIKSLPSAQPDHNADISKKVERTNGSSQNVQNGDLIPRQAAIDAIGALSDAMFKNIEKGATFPKRQWFDGMANAESIIKDLPSAQPEIIHCGECIYYDPPHVEKEDARYEYSEMPKEAFDVLGTGLVSMEYGINIGGRCCVDYYCKSYSDDKRVYVREDNYCGRAERRTE